MQQIGILVMTVTPVAEIAAKRGVTFAGAQAVAGEACMGVSDQKIEAGVNGKVITGLTGIWEAGAAIPAATTDLQVDANGRVIPLTGGAVVGKLVAGQEASAAGEFVEVFIINQRA